MKKITIITTFAALLITGSCKKDSEFLNVPPKQIVTADVAFSDPNLVLSILGDLYNRVVDFSGLDNGWASFADFSESFPSENGSSYFVQRTGWGYGEWGTWDYTYVRDLNLFIDRATAATKLTADQKNQFIAEGRFLRAQYYFELVKRMGGVPLITKPLDYDFSGNVIPLQVARAKESEVYDFIISEAEAIKGLLPAKVEEKSRATPGAILAMEARAALYAASIAKYGATTPQVSLPGGEVGIPASMATGYYTKALAAAKAIISGSAGNYSLYKQLPDLSDNFANIFLDKTSTESIWVEDFKANGGKTHGFTTNDQPYSISDEGLDAGRLDPSLNLVEAYEKLDNTYAPIATKDGSGNPIYYDNQLDAFAGRDARLAGTVLLPNGLFKGKRTDVWAGYQLADGSILTSGDAVQLKPLPGTTTPVQVVGKDGPVNGLEFRTQTGFYVRKYLDPTIGSGRRGRGSDVNFIRYRYAEVLLNGAEAAAELGDYTTASTYINQVRARAGLNTPLVLTAANYFDRIVHERRVELAFEGHTLFDMKRWRLATVVWDGNQMTVTDLVTNIGQAAKRNTQPFGLWPYKYYNPGNANNGKWLFKEVKPSSVTGANRFQLGNYYSQIGDNVLSANPKIVKQPNQ
ncbi:MULTISPECIES: RagB/SusD family nutrient uptake outer membrane protein [unclassified Mucilaginibacter]|uniref:RagB/SusD family nutrient uptake outer membrane protein n=1 Tax=unclassified Mucilaginibacter TaxID=2617802 RepID=UPI0008BC1964|nr:MULTISPECIES: RagB/SusD family nutrient uptake outer membrane protein [unclassified Mucilaginibacter]WDF81214.1 RagB/SusD family nutrient uptake outer membrane protein [Mucilaginibacter sp. KACC 22773]SEP14690.1 Starch-binding associating with outer membrane [Mucilaginibacter sp. OK283]